MIREFGFTKLIVADLALLERFYVNALGLNVVTRISVDEPDWALDEIVLGIADVKGCQLNLVQYRKRERPPPGEAVIGFYVKDIEAVCAAAVRGGGAISVPIQHLADHNLFVAYISDPEGHLIEVLEKTS